IMLGKVIIILVTFLLQGALSGNAVTFQTPDVLTISYIKNDPNFYKYCKQQLKNLVGIRDEGISNVSCQALGYSANDDPPRSFSNTKDNGGDFDKWARSKEYRGYIHIPSYISSDPKDPDYSDQHNPTQNPEKVVNTERNPYGYTKEYAPYIYLDYSSADIYTNDSTFNGIRWSKIKDNTCLSIFDARASRLSTTARYTQYFLLKYDAPFIYAKVYMTVCCNRQVSVTVHRTVFPQTSLYINGKKVSEQAQTELGKFILSGGKPAKDFKIAEDGNWIIKNIKTLLKNFQKDLGLLLSADGHGNLAPYGQDLTWNGKI
ncbi:11930_t:CDS:2, partial [Racocetra fulgida]